MTRSAGLDIARAFAQVTRDLAGHDDLLGTCEHIVQLARGTLGASGAAIWHLNGSATAAVDACTHPAFVELVHDIVDGPVWAALREHQLQVSPDLTVETRWPYYVSRLLAESPRRSVLSCPLAVGGHELGVLALASDQAGYFDEQMVELADVFATHVGLAMERASVAERNDRLIVALETNRRIGIATGILMSSLHLTDEEAFGLLRMTSQHGHRKLREVAEEVIEIGRIPDWE